MGNVEVVMNMAGFVTISNMAIQKVATPLANRVAAAAGPGHEVRVTPRAGVSSWGRARVWTNTLEAMRKEAHHGTLSRAFRSL